MNASASNIGTATEPLGGQPARGAKQSVSDLDEQVAYHRVIEAVLWAMPAVAICRLRVGLVELPGMADNVITAYSGPRVLKVKRAICLGLAALHQSNVRNGERPPSRKGPQADRCRAPMPPRSLDNLTTVLAPHAA